MTTYVVFDKSSGEIVHTHIEVSLLGEPMPRSESDVLALGERVFGDRAPDSLGVLEIAQDVLRQEVGVSRKVYVDVENRVLRMKESES
jgi:hypothetical protein